MDVLRAFGAEDENFTHYYSYSDGKFYNCIEYDGKFYDYENEFSTEDALVFRRFAKRYCKLAFYSTLSAVKGVKLPWGALTGIRPTKLAYAELAAGRDFSLLFKQLCVDESNISLVGEVIKSQKDIYACRGATDLYVSLPFCPTRCEYCSFVTAPVSAVGKYIPQYLDCLQREISRLKNIFSAPASVYVGGGTPFVLDLCSLERVYAAIQSAFGQGFEYTVEAGRPDVFDEQKLKLSRGYGVNRICVNPQSFNDKTLEKIGRKHTAAQTLEAYAMAEKYGFVINLDLIAGLADESVSDFEQSLKTAISLSPANITVHTLSLKCGSRLKESVKRLNIGGINQMISLSRDMLSSAGYVPYYLYRQKYQAGGLENVGWCKPGTACAYNVRVMEEISDNVAVGSGAISKKFFGEENRIERLASPKDIPSYLAKCEKIISDREKLFK